MVKWNVIVPNTVSAHITTDPVVLAGCGKNNFVFNAFSTIDDEKSLGSFIQNCVDAGKQATEVMFPLHEFICRPMLDNREKAYRFSDDTVLRLIRFYNGKHVPPRRQGSNCLPFRVAWNSTFFAIIFGDHAQRNLIPWEEISTFCRKIRSRMMGQESSSDGGAEEYSFRCREQGK
ncbi:hypothetical protein CEXT_14731 [Caerostris extrusa]|uniref:Uncharacterized protein n=1 Tax=Caerostris extrusa TaxID=172846 RepID=A0AAV4Y6X7_CAEEX|nr:hypothetical protein CEXT_14731 [Caerostris extrusa]